MKSILHNSFILLAVSNGFQKGWIEMNPANNYGTLKARRLDEEEIKYPLQRQQILQMDDFAQHVIEGTVNRATGEMGKRDMIICEAIYQSIAEGGRKIKLDLGRMGIVE